MDDASVLLLANLHELTLSKFNWNVCDFQLEFAQAVLKGRKHVLLQAGCGMGKTFGFWIPLLIQTSGSLIVVTPLTLLGDKHVENLIEAGIRAINVDADTVASCLHAFKVAISYQSLSTVQADTQQDIGSGAYHVIITSPEQLMREGGGFQ